MTITGQTALSSDEIQRMVTDAEAHAEEDRRRREEAEARNMADALVYQTEKLLREQGDRAPAAERQRVEDALRAVKEALEGDDVTAVRAATDTLVAASQSLGQHLYEQASSASREVSGRKCRVQVTAKVPDADPKYK